MGATNYSNAIARSNDSHSGFIMEEAEAASLTRRLASVCATGPPVNSELPPPPPPEDSIEPLPSASLKQPLLPQRFEIRTRGLSFFHHYKTRMYNIVPECMHVKYSYT